MRALDKTKVYDLSELTSEELQEIFTWLKNNDEDWHIVTFKNFKEGIDYARLAYVDNEWVWVYQEPTANAKELFYTLENVQVDCSELSEKQVKEMCEVYESNGYKQWIDEDTLIKTDFCNYLRIDWANEFYITGESGTKTTITYEKFMELFAESIQPQFLQKAIGEADKNCYYFHHSEKHGPNFYVKEEVPYHDGEDWKEDLVVYTQLGSGKKFVTTKERFKKFKEVWI